MKAELPPVRILTLVPASVNSSCRDQRPKQRQRHSLDSLPRPKSLLHSFSALTLRSDQPEGPVAHGFL